MPRSSWLTSTMFSVPPCGQAMWWLWTTSARTKWLAFENESRLPEPSCSICRPTRLTSTPSKKHGPSSSICSARPKPEPPRRSNKPSHNCFHRSGHKTRKHGSELRSTLYSKEEYALVRIIGCRRIILAKLVLMMLHQIAAGLERNESQVRALPGNIDRAAEGFEAIAGDILGPDVEAVSTGRN